jgi:DNA invertase Pin-like site-specific DNA recombinase
LRERAVELGWPAGAVAVVDEDTDFNDRLLLGLKGTMSEAELRFIRARLVGGLRNKAKRGELRLLLPAGLTATTTTGSCCVHG